jgi:hypothetical protein
MKGSQARAKFGFEQKSPTVFDPPGLIPRDILDETKTKRG